ncbi:hypothetical protein, partial [Mesorhizobium sp. M7A.F.Ca.CA.002.03.2.1]|uniref:hypothetical protein n=1 Tax=Mesorhizobium sp. M7A.F.Ca.CA.002.03.2.1 TaxID=2496680 RepID=UPI0019D4EBA9
VMPPDFVVEFVEFVVLGSEGFTDVPEPVPLLPPVFPDVAPVPSFEPEPLLEPELFDCATADVANVSASTAADRSLTIMVDLLVGCTATKPILS